VIDPITRTSAEELRRVATYLRSQWRWPSPECGFAAWLFLTTRCDPPLEPTQTEAPAQRFSEAPVLAAYGYLLAAGKAIAHAAWADGFRRLQRRNPFPADHASFAFRPVELLGLALGAKALGATGEIVETDWIKGVVERRLAEVGSADWWTYTLTTLAATAVGAAWTQRHMLDLTALSTAELGMLAWCCEGSSAGVSEPLRIATYERTIRELLVDRALEEGLQPRDVAEAAVLWHSVRSTVRQVIESRFEEFWQVNRTDRDALSLVVELCRRFPACVRQLARRQRNRQPFQIADEYDVQDLMRGLLALHFDDVRPEEWTPSYAGNNASRIDFLLKQERIVIEAKMTRPTLSQRQLADELIVDKERYRSHHECRILVCLVYDPEGRCDNPTALETDLSEPEGTPRVVVVVPQAHQ
jgi:hypothetical protein